MNSNILLVLPLFFLVKPVTSNHFFVENVNFVDDESFEPLNKPTTPSPLNTNSNTNLTLLKLYSYLNSRFPFVLSSLPFVY